MTDATADVPKQDRLTTILNNLRERSENILDADLVRYVLVFIAGGLTVSIIAAVLNAIDDNATWQWLAGTEAFLTWLDGFGQNFSTEMIGAVITFVLLEVLLTGRREKEAEKREKERLILQMGSPFNESAVEATRQLSAHGWLFDGSLKGGDFSYANLAGVNLQEANLVEAFLARANLIGANLQSANLANAILMYSDLKGANLAGSSLANTDLHGANLSNVKLAYTLLPDTNFSEANLFKANMVGSRLTEATLEELKHAKSLEGITLPDGTILPNGNMWRAKFETWYTSVKFDERGYIIPKLENNKSDA